MSKYAIHPVKKPRCEGDKFPFVLYNGTAVAGDRLYKGEAKGRKWPMKENFETLKDGGDCSWHRFPTMALAFQAAEKLQEYLDKHETTQTAASKKTKTDN